MPTSLERLKLFAERAVAGDPEAINHQKAQLMLGTAVLALITLDEVMKAKGGAA
jgi:hypothetical protein